MENETNQLSENQPVRENKSEQLNSKITPKARQRLDTLLKKLGYPIDANGHAQWNQEALEELMGISEEKILLDDHESYADTIVSINQYTSLINSKIYSLINDLDNSEARIRSDYEAKLTSKDQIISDLQRQLNIQENEKNSAIESASKSKDAQTIAEKNRNDAEEQLKKSEATVKDKESIIEMLTSKLKESEDKLSGYDVLKSSESSLKDQVSMLLHQKELAETKAAFSDSQFKDEKSNNDKLNEQIISLQKERETLHDKNIKLQRDLEDKNRTISQLKENAKKDTELAVERAVKKAEDSIREKMFADNQKLQDQIISIREEKARIETQLDNMSAAKVDLESQLDNMRVAMADLESQLDNNRTLSDDVSK